MDYSPRDSVAMEYAASPTPLSFYFCLSGHSRVQASNVKVEATPGKADFSFYQNTGNTSITETFGMERFVRVGIYMDLEQFESYIDKDTAATLMLLNDPSAEVINYGGQITMAMRSTIFQILNCPYQDTARNLFLESKALELIAHKIGQIKSTKVQNSIRNPLFTSEINRIKEAAHLLTSDLENPPDMNTLASLVGLSRSSLYRHFAKVYRQSPFDYLRNHRMKTAMELLQTGEANVSEAAYFVGYSNMSHFTKTFKEMFGVKPSELLNEPSRYYGTLQRYS